jgi:hypothetical protein
MSTLRPAAASPREREREQLSRVYRLRIISLAIGTQNWLRFTQNWLRFTQNWLRFTQNWLRSTILRSGPLNYDAEQVPAAALQDDDSWAAQERDEARAGDSSSPNQQVWMEQRYKLFGCNSYDGGPMTYFLYDLSEDEYEMHDLSSAMPDRVRAMRNSLAAWIASVAKSRGPAETNCENWTPCPPGQCYRSYACENCSKPAPPPPPSPGPFRPTVNSNCTYQEHRTMPASRPIKVPNVASATDCCAACFNTSFCVVAIYQRELRSCNMHTLSDNKPLAHGEDVACVTGRTGH